MNDYWNQLVGTVVTGVLALTAGVGVPGRSVQQPDESPSAEAPRHPSADEVEPRAKQRDGVRERAEARAGVSRLGHDISWPQCPTGMGIPARRTLGKPIPPPDTGYLVIGLTNGPAFYPNPCLAEQVAHSRRHHIWTSAYAVVTYPTAVQLQQFGGRGPREAGTAAGRLYNTGWAQAQVNIASMRAAGLDSPGLWVDVEPVRPPAPWSSDEVANRTVVEGSMAAYRKAGLRLGVYSTRLLWRSVVGDVDYGLPEWRAAGATSRQRALAQCAPDRAIQGGEPVFGQWTDYEYDFNVMCPGRRPLDVLRTFFVPL